MRCRCAGDEVRSRLSLRAAALFALIVAAVLLVPLLAQKAYAGAAPTLSYSGSTITCQYSNNVAAGRVFSSNAAAWAVGPDGATVNLSVWRNYYGEGSPDAANPDTYGERRRLYIDTSSLLPGTTYTVAKGAAVSLGGDSYPAASITITTPGTPPTPPEPEPDPDPDPVDPPDGGDGGSQGNGGSDSTGDGADQGMPGDASDDPSAGSGEPSAGESASSSAPSASQSDAPSASDAPSSQADAANADDPAESSENAAAGESRAAGIGGGTVYLVGEAGADPGKQTEDVAEPSVALATMVALACVGVAVAAAGAVKRIVVWRRHLSNGDHHED